MLTTNNSMIKSTKTQWLSTYSLLGVVDRFKFVSFTAGILFIVLLHLFFRGYFVCKKKMINITFVHLGYTLKQKYTRNTDSTYESFYCDQPCKRPIQLLHTCQLSGPGELTSAVTVYLGGQKF